MSSVLAQLKEKKTRTGQSPAGVGATLAYNEIIKDVLPPIVAELEKKISELQEKIDNMKRPTGTGLSAVRGLKGSGYTRRRNRF
jgi:superfamily I DNA and RNA helicase